MNVFISNMNLRFDALLTLLKYLNLLHSHLTPSSRMREAIPPLLQYAFTAWCSIKAQGQLYLLPLPV